MNQCYFQINPFIYRAILPKNSFITLWLAKRYHILGTNEKKLYLTSSIESEIFEQIEKDENKGINYFAENVKFKIENSG